jgi:hypothetical protein
LRIRFQIRGRYFNQEQYEAGYKTKSHLRGEREAVSGSWRDLSPQRLRDPLDPAVLRHPSILRLNPNREPAKPCVYVGMTGLLVEHRFENHKNGQQSAWAVRKYGLRLMPELYGFLNPMPFEAAAQMEKDLAEDLRAEGYTVAGGT